MIEDRKTEDRQEILSKYDNSQPRKHINNLHDDDGANVSDKNQSILALEETEEETDKHGDKAKEFCVGNLSKNKKIMLALLALVNFLLSCMFALPGPFFPQEAAKKGVSKTVVGLIFSCYFFVVFLSTPVFGKFITRVGANLLYTVGSVVAGTLGICFGLLNLAFSGTSYIVMCFLCRAGIAVGVSACATTSFAVVCHTFPEYVAMVYGTLETTTGLGLMCGPAIGGFLYGAGGFGVPFYVIGGAVILCGVAGFKFCPFPQDVHVQRSSGFCCLLSSMAVWVGLLCNFVGMLCCSYLDTTLSTYLLKFHLSGSTIGFVFMATRGLYSLSSPLLGYLTDRLNVQAPFIIIFGFLGCTIACLLVGPSPLLPFLPVELWLVILGLAMQGTFASSFVVPAIKCMVYGARELGFEENLQTYGLLSSVFYTAFCTGSVVGPLLGGVLTEIFGFRYTSSCVGGLFLLTAIICSLYFLFRCIKRRRGGEGGQHVPYEIIVKGGQRGHYRDRTRSNVLRISGKWALVKRTAMND